MKAISQDFLYFFRYSFIAFVLSLGLIAPSGHAATVSWNQPGSGNWNVPGNWTGGFPTQNDIASIDNSGTALVPAGVSATANTISVGGLVNGSLILDGGLITTSVTRIASFAGAGTISVKSGTWMNNSSFFVGSSGNGTLLISGGLLQQDHGTGYIDSYASGGLSSAVVTGGTWASGAYVGYGANGSLLVDGGVVTGGAVIGELGASTGLVTVNSGTLGGNVIVGDYGKGTFLLNGGSVSDLASNNKIGLSYSGSGVATVTGGTWYNHNLTVGYSGTGTLNINGGRVVVSSTLAIAQGFYGVEINRGTLNLNAGGTLELGGGVDGLASGTSGPATINFSGGILRVITTDLTSAVNATLSGTSTIDTNSINATFSGILSGTGGLTKVGNGMLMLTGSNTYTGGTTITSGTVSSGHNSALGTGTVSVEGGMLFVQIGVTNANAIQLKGGEYDRSLGAGANLSHALDATSSFAGGHLDTIASILQGTLSSTSTLQSSFLDTSNAHNDQIRLSDVYRFQGTGSDIFVLQLSITSVNTDSFLAYLDGNGYWVNAVFGNTGGTPTFVAEAYDPLSDFHLGYYGIDMVHGVAWAVLDHNSDYAIVPEPSTLALLVLGGTGFLMRRRWVSQS